MWLVQVDSLENIELLPPDFIVKMHQIWFSAGALPQTLLEELAALSQISGWIQGVTHNAIYSHSFSVLAVWWMH